MRELGSSWQTWAILSALFAALTAIFAKVGVERIDSDVATLFRTLVVVVALTALLLATKGLSVPTLSGRSVLFLVLSGLATGASWLCYFRALKIGDAARVAPVDKLSVVMVALVGAAFLGERLSALGWLGIALVGGGAVLVAIG
jgi:bacterial/archaeal transporter family protein